MKDKTKKSRRILRLVLCAVLLITAGICFAVTAHLARLLPSQQAAERWQGDGETQYGQVSCFLPVDERIDLKQIYQFRYAVLDRLREAGFEADTDTLLFRDAWCTTGKVNISGEHGHGVASVIAVGGNFFDFHPLRLLNGNFIAESDLMKDQVLLDEELAWLLYGGDDLQGLEVRIEGVPFVVAGVIEREQDFASQRAYTSGMGLYMSYDAYTSLNEEAGADCYELVMAEPVKDFTVSFAREKFPIGQGIIVENSKRYTALSLLKLLGQFGTRSMQTQGVIYPYWENAARCVEDWCTMLLLLGILAALYPLIVGAVLLVRVLKKGKEKLAEDVLPAWKDKAEEAVRKQQRKHWERKHKDEI